MTTTVLAYLPSPSQGVWHLGPVPLRAYALCIIVGIVAALIIGDRRWQARGGEPGVIYDIALWAVPFGLVGGRLYHVLTDWKTYFGPTGKGFGAALQIWEGGLGIWGAVALGAVGAWIACRIRGIPLPAFGDAIAPGIILAQGIGRLGNYFNQELYGRPTTLPWGLEIYERINAAGQSDQLNGVSTGQVTAVVHPTFLYELLWNIAVFAFLIWVDRRYRIGHGRLFALYVAAYCVGRFAVELMRSDTATEFAGIRVNTFTSTFVFIGAVVYIMLAPKGREEPESLRGKTVGEDEETDEDSLIDAAGKELVTAAAGTGVVAAAAVAVQEESEDSSRDTDLSSVSDELDESDDSETSEPETDETAAVATADTDGDEQVAEEADGEADGEAEEPVDELLELDPEGETAEAEPAAAGDVEATVGSEDAAIDAEAAESDSADGEDAIEIEPEAETVGADVDEPDSAEDAPDQAIGESAAEPDADSGAASGAEEIEPAAEGTADTGTPQGEAADEQAEETEAADDSATEQAEISDADAAVDEEDSEPAADEAEPVEADAETDGEAVATEEAAAEEAAADETAAEETAAEETAAEETAAEEPEAAVESPVTAAEATSDDTEEDGADAEAVETDAAASVEAPESETADEAGAESADGAGHETGETDADAGSAVDETTDETTDAPTIEEPDAEPVSPEAGDNTTDGDRPEVSAEATPSATEPVSREKGGLRRWLRRNR
ncbi:prolipoprotein diacylglyceryl transferase [Mycolicibacterium goodii]|uniref:prolipoprotein diacylglyceryl transferase n=1 Tax=Mycolicibacterium goodii TaxID=134601 RepID=UPI001BDD6546|nr:prolipoprotein diacylglyceryl transferase [Mycolicibacterium goodii]MBU8828649.1 prolipoprotein diacylglyceryl transferase [Mycolicibacterium goodii]